MNAKSEIDLIIEQTLRKLKMTKPPLSVLKVCDSEGIKVRIGETEDDTSGFAIFKADEKFIYVNEKENKLRQRFTICHELGHYFLHYKPNPGEFSEYFKKDSTYFRDEVSRTGEDTLEKEANYFASRILIPENWLFEEIQRHGLKLDHMDDEEIITLADVFKVTVQSMAIRLGNL